MAKRKRKHTAISLLEREFLIKRHAKVNNWIYDLTNALAEQNNNPHMIQLLTKQLETLTTYKDTVGLALDVVSGIRNINGEYI